MPEGTVTLLFTDIEGSTRLLRRLQQDYAALLADQRRILRGVFEKWGGREVDTQGDSFFISFPRAGDALAAAVEAQRRLAAHVWPEGQSVRVRMGLHTGEPWRGDEGYIGLDVHRAARIASCGYGGQVLLSETCAGLVRDHLPEDVLLRDLGAHGLKDFPGPERIFQLVIPGLPADFPTLRSLDARPNNLPAQTTPFVGRLHELAELEALIADPSIRLITILGPGGMGKTRLALAAAEEQLEAMVPVNGKQAPRFPNGVFFISLAPLEDIEAIISTIADAVGFRFYQGAPPKTQLLDYFRHKTCLLVMDNFEHLLEGTPILSEILQAAPGVKILATSRQKLGLHAETVFHLWGMRLPESEALAEATTLLEDARYSALQLFLRSARRVRPNLEFSPDELKTAAKICRLVGGLPLGIELAAAWLGVLSLEEIAAEIQAGFDFLEAERRDAPERHHSIRAVIDHSWRLLSPQERDVFKKLSVFRGGFTRQAAEQVCDAGLRQLAALANKSLLRRDRQGRYQIHELLGQYGAEKLGEDPAEYEKARDRHCEYYLDFVHQMEAAIRSGDQYLAWVEIDNIRPAYRWAIRWKKVGFIHKAQVGLIWLYDYHSWLEPVALFESASAALEMAQPAGEKGIVYGQVLGNWGGYLGMLGRVSEGLPLMRKSRLILCKLNAQAELAIINSDLGWLSPDQEEAKQCRQDSLAYYRNAGVDWGIALVLTNEGVIALANGNIQDAECYIQEAMEINLALNDRRGMTWVHANLGTIALQKGEYATAKKHFQDCYSVAQTIDYKQYMYDACMGLGNVASLSGESEQAQIHFEQALDIAREVGNPQQIAWATGSLGYTAYTSGDYDAAKTHYSEALAEFKKLDHSRGLASTYCDLGTLALATGDREEARSTLLRVLELAIEMQRERSYLMVLSDVALYIEALGNLTRAVEIATLVAGHTSTWVFHRENAKKLLARAASKLSPQDFAAAQERGEVLELEATVKVLLEELKAITNPGLGEKDANTGE